MAVVFLQRIASWLGLLPARRAVRFAAPFTGTDYADSTLTSIIGGDGQVTGYTEIGLYTPTFIAYGLDSNTSSASYVTLFSASLPATFPGGAVLVEVRALLTQLGIPGTASVQLLVDGVAVQQCPLYATASETKLFTLLDAERLTAGAHMLTVQWKTSAGTLRCNAASTAEGVQLYCQIVGT